MSFWETVLPWVSSFVKWGVDLMIYWVPFKSNFEYAVISESYGHASIFIYAKHIAAAKSLQSCPTLCDSINSGPPGSPSRGFSRQEQWSGLPFPSPVRESEVDQLCLTLSNPMDCSLPGSSSHGIFQARVLVWGYHCLLQQNPLIAYYFQVLRQRQLYKVPALKAIIANGEGKQAKSNYNTTE